MEYTLKDKLNVTKEFLNELTEKSWQEIDYLQNQIANLIDTDDGKKLAQLLKSLLTSYYIFVGGLENFESDEPAKMPQPTEPVLDEPTTVADEPEVINYEITDLEDTIEDTRDSNSTPIEPIFSEPFEYFVDFDEPIDKPLTDEDLYN